MNKMWKQTVFLQRSLFHLKDPVLSSIILHIEEAQRQLSSFLFLLAPNDSHFILSVSYTCQIP